MKKLLLIMALCGAFSGNAQLREAISASTWQGEGTIKSLNQFDGKLCFSSSFYLPSTRRIHLSNGNGSVQTLRGNGRNLYNLTPSVNFHVFNSELYFDGFEYDSGIPTIMKIYKLSSAASSSSTINTTEVFNITGLTGATSSRFFEPAFLNNKIVFSPSVVNGGAGVEPYVVDLSNSANSGLLLDVNNGATSSNPRHFTTINNKIIFAATDVTNGTELWQTDGTTAGTTLFQDINTGSGSSDPDQLSVLSSQLIFVATHATLGRELFKTNGVSSLTLIKDINTSGNSNPTNVTELNGTLYFSADNGAVGQELWKSNGFNSGTLLIKDINPSGNSNPSNFIQLGSDVYFTADDGTNGVELWKTDGTNAGTVLVKNINTSGNSDPKFLTEYNGKLYFIAKNNSNIDNLWVSDGTSSGTLPITAAISNEFSLTENLFVFNNELYFNYAAPGDPAAGTLYAYMDPTLSIDDFDEIRTSISLFPNPTNNYFEIESNSTLDKVGIYSLQGQVIKSFEPQNQYDISELSSGVYFVKIQADKNEITKRIIKQ